MLKNGKDSKAGVTAPKAQVSSTAAAPTASVAASAADPAEPADAQAEAAAPAAAAAAEAPVVPPAARPAARPAVTGKKVLAPRKPAAKSGGLGVKKLATKVDDSLFDQKPAEPVAPVPVGAGSTASEGAYLAHGPSRRRTHGPAERCAEGPPVFFPCYKIGRHRCVALCRLTLRGLTRTQARGSSQLRSSPSACT